MISPEVKLSLLADHMFFYLKDRINSTKNLLDIITSFFKL
jgi:hypothetical protein